ncbi:MAG: DUF1816 domain-containing protein [Cyanobacteria bacterium P01_A01_bin.105]
MKSFFGNLLGVFTNSWWIQISTDQPQVIYYFGPFDSEEEAAQYQGGYIEDLEQEGAQGIRTLTTRRDEPEELTVEASPLPTGTPVLSL